MNANSFEKLCKRSVLATILLASSMGAFAQLTADPLPGDPKLVVFSFDENNS